MVYAQRFGYFAGLRALAVAGILVFEVLKHAPALAFNPLLHRAGFDGLHGFELLIVLAGFALAYPPLAALRAEGAASLDPGNFALGRALRLVPTYYAVVALTLLLPYAAEGYGLTPDHHALPALGSAVAQLLFAGSNFGNDAFWGLSVLVRVLVLFPLLLAVYVRKPGLFAGLAAVAALASLLTPAHRLEIGALPVLMLGIVAADLRVCSHRWERHALPLAGAAALAAFALDPWIASLPGPRLSTGIESWNPLWAVAAFALVVAPAQLPWLQRVLSFRILALFGAAAYAIALVAEPVAAFIVRNATPTLGLETAAVHALLIALLAGLALWLAVDRHFADADFRRRIVDAARAAYLNLRTATQLRTQSFGAGDPDGAADPAAHAFLSQSPVDLAVLIKRTGSPGELHADILATKARFAQRGTFAPFFFGAARVVQPARIVNGAEVVAEAEREETALDREPIKRRSSIHLHIGPSSGATYV